MASVAGLALRGSVGKIWARRVRSFAEGGPEKGAQTLEARSIKGRKNSSGRGVKEAC